MKVVYLLVSDEKDLYLEQCLISILSLRKNNPNVYVYLLVDKKTEKTFNVSNRTKICTYIDKLVSIAVPDQYNKKDTSRFLKTSMYRYIPDDFLYIDVDTVICDRLSMDDMSFQVAGVLDKHYLLSEHPLAEGIYRQAQKCGYHDGFENCHFNSGLMWVKKSELTERFFETWHELWKQGLSKGVTQDQASLNEANYIMKGVISELDGEWNCQIANQTQGLKYLNRAKIIHYFASCGNEGAPYDLDNVEIIKSVLDNPDPRLNMILERPKEAFSAVKYIISDKDDGEILQSQIFERLRYIKKKRPSLFKWFNKIFFVINYRQNNGIFRTFNTVIRDIKKSLTHRS